MEQFQNIFCRPLFTVIFRPKIIVLDTDSIFRVLCEAVKLDLLRSENDLKRQSVTEPVQMSLPLNYLPFNLDQNRSR
jgi:hypothetical protein